jgi:hypothetical protein
MVKRGRILMVVGLFASLGGELWAGSAELSWDPSSGSNLAGYKVYYGLTRRANDCPSTDYGTPIDVGNVTTFTINGLEDGKRYFFSVTAYDSAANETCFSNEASKYMGPLAERAIYIDNTTRAFSPYDSNAERKHAILNFNVGSANAVKNIHIHNVRGERIRTLMDHDVVTGGGNFAGQAAGSVDWDGTDDNGSLVPMGLYIIYLNAEDPATGIEQTSQDKVAFGRPF